MLAKILIAPVVMKIQNSIHEQIVNQNLELVFEGIGFGKGEVRKQWHYFLPTLVETALLVSYCKPFLSYQYL